MLRVLLYGISPVPQSACPALDLTATAASRPSTARNVALSVAARRGPPRAARRKRALLSVQDVGRLFSASPSQHGAPLTANAPSWSSGGVLYTLLSMPSTSSSTTFQSRQTVGHMRGLRKATHDGRKSAWGAGPLAQLLAPIQRDDFAFPGCLRASQKSCALTPHGECHRAPTKSR